MQNDCDIEMTGKWQIEKHPFDSCVYVDNPVDLVDFFGENLQKTDIHFAVINYKVLLKEKFHIYLVK